MSNEATELSTEEWKQRKKEKKAQMAAMQALPYEVKVKRAELRAREFVEKLCCKDPRTGEKYGWGRVFGLHRSAVGG